MYAKNIFHPNGIDDFDCFLSYTVVIYRLRYFRYLLNKDGERSEVVKLIASTSSNATPPPFSDLPLYDI